MKTSEVLRAARAKIAQGWTQVVLARDAAGERTAPDMSDAVCWCAFGAVAAVATKVEEDADACEALARSLGDGADAAAIEDFNDAEGRTQAEVLDLFDRAAALCEAEGK